MRPAATRKVEPSGTGFWRHNPSARQHGAVKTSRGRTCNPHRSGAAVAASGTFRAGRKPTAADPADQSRRGMSTPPSTFSPRERRCGPLGRLRRSGTAFESGLTRHSRKRDPTLGSCRASLPAAEVYRDGRRANWASERLNARRWIRARWSAATSSRRVSASEDCRKYRSGSSIAEKN